MNSNFFYRPLWQQQILIFICCSLIFLLSYYFLMMDLTGVVEQYQINCEQKEIQIEQLQAKYPEQQIYQAKASSPISERILADLFQKHDLVLERFIRQPIDNGNNWHIELTGTYSDFLSLVGNITDLHRNTKIENLSIQKREPDQLIFNLNIHTSKEND